MRFSGKCLGGPYHGEYHAHFAETMRVDRLERDPIGGLFFLRGYYEHSEKMGSWVWNGPIVKNRANAQEA